MVVVGDHELIATALRDRPDGFRRTAKLEEVWTEMGLLGGLFGANGDTWRRQRRMVMTAFDPGHVRRHFPSLQQVAKALAARWQGAAQDGRAIDLQADLMRYTVDTTANTIAWMIHLLWRHPAALARATEEVRRVCADPSAPTLDEVAQLDCIDACINESMGLKPVAPQNGMQALRDTTLGDGPRICPGRYLALLEMKVAMATLLGRFDITAVDTPDGQEPRELLQLAMAPVGLSMRLAQRV